MRPRNESKKGYLEGRVTRQWMDKEVEEGRMRKGRSEGGKEATRVCQRSDPGGKYRVIWQSGETPRGTKGSES